MRRPSPPSLLVRTLDQSGRENHALTFGLAALLIATIAVSASTFLNWPLAVDVEIPLRAASRWAQGGQPYVPSSFTVTAGPGLPYLYPPWLLPALAPIAALPRATVEGCWMIAMVAVAVWTCRRLGVPWRAVPVILLWPPYLEGLVTGNVQILQFAAFVALFFLPGRDWHLRPHQVFDDGGRYSLRRDLTDGFLAAGVGAVKYAQLLPLVCLLRPRPRAAAIGLLALAVTGVAMLPFTGFAIYGDWLSQLSRAADPGWVPAGGPLLFVVGRPLATAAALVAVGAMFTARGRDLGAWVGIALLVAAPSIHGYGMLFLVPALMILRRDLALFLAILAASYDIHGWWIAIGIAGVALAASYWVPELRAQADAHGPNDGATARTAAERLDRLSEGVDFGAVSKHVED